MSHDRRYPVDRYMRQRNGYRLAHGWWNGKAPSDRPPRDDVVTGDDAATAYVGEYSRGKPPDRDEPTDA